MLPEKIVKLIHNGWQFHVYPHRRGGVWAILLPDSIDCSEFMGATNDPDANGEYIFTTSRWCPVVHAYAANVAVEELCRRIDSHMSSEKQLHAMKLILFSLEMRLDTYTQQRYVLPENIEDHVG